MVEPVPPSDDVTRWIKPRLLGRNDAGEVALDHQGRPAFVFPQAFELREHEEGLSLTWLQPFGRGRGEQLPRAAEAVRRTAPSGKLQKTSAFAVANVKAIKEAGQAHEASLRVLTAPIDGNEGHCEIRRLPRESGPLHLLLASETFAERYTYEHIQSGAC